MWQADKKKNTWFQENGSHNLLTKVLKEYLNFFIESVKVDSSRWYSRLIAFDFIKIKKLEEIFTGGSLSTVSLIFSREIIMEKMRWSIIFKSHSRLIFRKKKKE